MVESTVLPDILLRELPFEARTSGMLNFSHPASWTTLLAITVAAVVYYAGRHSRAKYPPGPKPEFFFGNARQVPTSMQWLRFAEWSQQYGMPARYVA